MNAILKRFAGGFLVLASLLVWVPAWAASLGLDPSGGALFGSDGETVGWGFMLSNDGNDAGYLVVTSAEFLFPPSQAIGSFTDFVGPQYLVVGPGETITQTFDAMTQRGIGKFVLNPDAPVYELVSGLIYLSYDLYSVDPKVSANPDDYLISSGNTLIADASVSVVPEPGSLLLMASAMPALVALRRRVQPWDRAAANG